MYKVRELYTKIFFLNQRKCANIISISFASNARELTCTRLPHTWCLQLLCVVECVGKCGSERDARFSFWGGYYPGRRVICHYPAANWSLLWRWKPFYFPTWRFSAKSENKTSVSMSEKARIYRLPGLHEVDMYNCTCQLTIPLQSMWITVFLNHRYLGSANFAFKHSFTTILNHKNCLNTCGQGSEKDPIRY